MQLMSVGNKQGLVTESECSDNFNTKTLLCFSLMQGGRRNETFSHVSQEGLKIKPTLTSNKGDRDSILLSKDLDSRFNRPARCVVQEESGWGYVQPTYQREWQENVWRRKEADAAEWGAAMPKVNTLKNWWGKDSGVPEKAISGSSTW